MTGNHGRTVRSDLSHTDLDALEIGPDDHFPFGSVIRCPEEHLVVRPDQIFAAGNAACVRPGAHQDHPMSRRNDEPFFAPVAAAIPPIVSGIDAEVGRFDGNERVVHNHKRFSRKPESAISDNAFMGPPFSRHVVRWFRRQLQYGNDLNGIENPVTND